jgi:hypothetical protein
MALYLRGVRIGNGEDDDDHRSLSSFVFHRSDEGQNKKRHENEDFVPSSLCLRRARARGGEDDDDL